MPFHTMRRARFFFARGIRFSLGLFCLLASSPLASSRSGFCQDAPSAPPGGLARPAWKTGDTWQIDTVTEKLQSSEPVAAADGPRIRWKFTIAGVEKIEGHACWRIDVECLAKGGLQPATSIWVDEETYFLRQFQTQVPVAGALRTVRESYEPGATGASPVMPPINVLPVSLPAFIAASPKGEFKYTSKVAGQAKDVGSQMKFVHAVSQDVKPATPKTLENVPRGLSKSLEKQPAVEVRLGTKRQQVLQVWQSNRPWPVFAQDGATKAWLVVEPPAANR